MYLNNYNVPVKTQHIISVTLHSDMCRLETVIIRLPLIRTIFKAYKLTGHIWVPKGLTRVQTIFKAYKVTGHIWVPKGLTRVYYNNINHNMVHLKVYNV